MLLIERLFRRLAYVFGAALIVTVGLVDSERFWHLPMMTWIVAVILFIFSWRIQKEYAEIITKLDGPDAQPTDPVVWVTGDNRVAYHIIWSAIYTFGTYIVVMLPIDWFIEDTRQWRPYFIAIGAIIFVCARIVDPKARASFYHKKS